MLILLKFQIRTIQVNVYNVLEDVLIEKTMVQMIKKHTWERKYKEKIKCSLLDHLYCNNIQSIDTVLNEKQICSDHNLIFAKVKIENTKFPENKQITILDWSEYSLN